MAHRVSAIEQSGLTASSGGGRRVLVVDDEMDNRNMLAELLQLLGFEVIRASDGGEALRKLAEQPVDLVLTDLYMPQMDGIELIERIATRHPTARIIAITGRQHVASRSVSAVARSLGASVALVKPFTLVQLQQAIEVALAVPASAASAERTSDPSLTLATGS